MPRPGRPRISTGIQESRTLALYNSGRALLSVNDYEAFSVADVAKGAACSVGAFYVRFADKDAFLRFVIAESFTSAALHLQNELNSGDIKAVGPSARAWLAVGLLMDQFADATFAGLVRADVKLALSDTTARSQLADYRDYATELISEWIAERRSRQMAQVRTALRVIFGALTDAVLSGGGTQVLGTGSFRTAFIHLLEGAISGDLNSGSKSSGKTVGRIPDQKRSKNPEPVSAQRKPARKEALKSAPKSSLPKTSSPVPSGRTRKV
ncbi:MAG TPA: TetR/AcrR family transcriptional regulator [Bryobacteraceae bacterium]|nr:TetR/AcrR family transcriptional regulator [Bryobacteraceae bacterium]